MKDKVNKWFIGNKRLDLAIILILLLLPLITYRKLIFTSGTIYSHDLVGLYYPLLISGTKALGEGIIPLWTPYIFSGMPLIGDMQMLIFYPLRILSLFFTLPKVVNYSFPLHCFLAGLFMYLYVKKITDKGSSSQSLNIGNSFSALLAGVTFMYASIFSYQVTIPPLLYSITWTPLPFLLLEIALEKRKFIFYILPGAALALQFLAGFPEVSMITGFAFLAYFIFKIVPLISEEGFNSKSLKDIALLIIAIMIGLSLSSIQLLPTIDLARVSLRSAGIDYAEIRYNSLPPYKMLNLIFFHVIPAFGIDVHNGYIGVPPIILGLIAIFVKRNRYSWFFLFLALFGIIISMGNRTPFYIVLTRLFPPIKSFRTFFRMLFIYAFAGSVLAGLGASSIKEGEESSPLPLLSLNKGEENRERRMRVIVKILIIVCLALLIIALISSLGEGKTILYLGRKAVDIFYDRLKRGVNPKSYYLEMIERAVPVLIRNMYYLTIILLASSIALFLYLKKRINPVITKILLTAIILFNLFTLGGSMHSVNDESDFANVERVYSAGIKEELIDFLSHNSKPYSRLYFADAISFPNSSLSLGLNSIWGMNQLALKDYYEALEGKIDRTFYTPQLLNRLGLMDLLNIEYIITVVGSPNNTYLHSLLGDRIELAYSDGEIEVFSNKTALPKAFIVPQAKIVASGKESLDEINSESFDPKEYVVLERTDNNLGEIPSQLSNTAISSQTELLSYSPTKIEIKADLKESGFLVLSEVYHLGWRAYIDEAEVNILRANRVLRAIHLNKGEHKIDFIYDPPSYRAGAFLTYLSLMIIITLASFEIFKRWAR